MPRGEVIGVVTKDGKRGAGSDCRAPECRYEGITSADRRESELDHEALSGHGLYPRALS